MIASLTHTSPPQLSSITSQQPIITFSPSFKRPTLMAHPSSCSAATHLQPFTPSSIHSFTELIQEAIFALYHFIAVGGHVPIQFMGEKHFFLKEFSKTKLKNVFTDDYLKAIVITNLLNLYSFGWKSFLLANIIYIFDYCFESSRALWTSGSGLLQVPKSGLNMVWLHFSFMQLKYRTVSMKMWN